MDHSEVKKQPFSGIRIVDVGHILAGPMTSSILADFGAEVIHVESPETGNFDRELLGAAGIQKQSRGWDIINRNKKNITLDLRKTQARDVMQRLLKISDVLTENFRPYVMPRWGHDWPTLHNLNSRLIYCRLSGYGLTGPRQHRRAYGRIAEAFGGWAYMNGHEDGPALHSNFSWGDTLDSIWAANAIIAALYWRDAQGGGEGMLIDQGLIEPMYRALEQQIIIYDQHEVSPKRFGTQHEATPYAGVSQTKDGRYFSWSAPTRTYIESLLNAVGLAEDDRFSNFDACMKHREEFQEVVAAWMKARDTAEIWDIFEKNQAIGSPVMTGEDLFKDPHVRTRGMLVSVPDPEGGKDIMMQGIVPKMSETPGSVHTACRPLGADNEEIYCGLLGLSQQELKDLEQAGVIHSSKRALD